MEEPGICLPTSSTGQDKSGADAPERLPTCSSAQLDSFRGTNKQHHSRGHRWTGFISYTRTASPHAGTLLRVLIGSLLRASIRAPPLSGGAPPPLSGGAPPPLSGGAPPPRSGAVLSVGRDRRA
ncbi:unnamed protein product [Boreogadus saida]